MRDAERCINGVGAVLVAQNDDQGFDGLIPQLLTSLPALNGAVSCLAQTTTYFTGCFSDYAADSSAGDSSDSIVHAQELETYSSVPTEDDSVTSNHPISSESSSALSESSTLAITASANNDGIDRASAGDPSENTGAIIQSDHHGQNGISIFQGLIKRAQRTVRGSADDIGWLKRDPEMPPVEDATEKFTEILDNIRHGLHKLPNSMVYLLVPGMLAIFPPGSYDICTLGTSREETILETKRRGSNFIPFLNSTISRKLHSLLKISVDRLRHQSFFLKKIRWKGNFLKTAFPNQPLIEFDYLTKYMSTF